jgi:2-oxoglutarate dehydrogenase E2 component (dihydrolipoamide succinyltransferase)
MHNEIEIVLPKLGESILNATVVRWFKKVGERVSKDEPLLEVTTDKVNSEIPSTISGVIKKILVQEDGEVEVGEALVVIEAESLGVAGPTQLNSSSSIARSVCDFTDFLSPAVLKVAREHQIQIEELKKIEGSGEGSRITKKDIENYLLNKAKQNIPKIEQTELVERIKMSNMRQAIATNMSKSFYQAPHASLITEIDVTGIVSHLKEIKESFFSNHGFKLTISSFIARAIARAAQKYPYLNSSVEGDTILIKKYVNLGIAVNVDHGILVPVIKDCHKLEMKQIASHLADFAKRAKEGELKVDETKEGTITMTNFGMSGTLIGIPIIRFPEVAIVGIGAIHKKVAVLENDTFAIRSFINISLTFDHRVIDGIYGCEFLKELKTELETNFCE